MHIDHEKCAWALASPNLEKYHDLEWGVPVYDDQRLFEFLILEGAQAGLSWSTVLNKRDAYRRAFDQFKVTSVAQFDQQKVNLLLKDSGLIRNRLKLNAVIINAQAFIKVQQTFGCFSHYLWQFVDGKPVINQWKQGSDIPVTTPIAERMSKDLKQRGFKFVGSIICYAYMQAVGLVNDHVVDCQRYSEINCLNKVSAHP